METDRDGECSGDAADDADHMLFRYPKYLTSRKLLRLELGDTHTRRAILVQLLIVCQYWCVRAKFKTAKQVLTAEQLEWTKKTEVTFITIAVQVQLC